MALRGNNNALTWRFGMQAGLVAAVLLCDIWLASGALHAVHGFHANGAGLWLWMALGWVLQAFLVCGLAGRQLPKRWRWLLIAFLLLTDSRYRVFQPYWGSGLTALFSVWWVQKYLKSLYSGRASNGWLALAGGFTGVCLWLVPGTGLGLVLGLVVFSLLHCFLHEREEKGVSYRLVSNREVLTRWAKSWGLYWGLSALAMAGGGNGRFNWAGTETGLLGAVACIFNGVAWAAGREFWLLLQFSP